MSIDLKLSMYVEFQYAERQNVDLILTKLNFFEPLLIAPMGVWCPPQVLDATVGVM
jgi:hypothetical protein